MPCRTVLRAAFAAALCLTAPALADVEPLSVQGEDFVDLDGDRVRFWGVNLVALYPTHRQADAIAAELAERGINLARPHHMMRNSLDWVSGDVGALQTYDGTSREPDAEAWDRFDYLNAQLREHGIYLQFALRWSRKYEAGDVDILETTPEDRQAWIDAMAELDARDWRSGISVRKMLPLIDERVRLIDEEFARQVMTHENPYTGMSYSEDPQVVTVEVINEQSFEYAIICQNKFPPYWERKVLAMWDDYAAEHGLEDEGDLYAPQSNEQKRVRSQFFRDTEQAHFERMKAIVRESDDDVAVTYSNYWLGENTLDMQREVADHNEDHKYADPLVVRQPDDLFGPLTRNALADKPLIISELNQAEGGDNIAAQARYRTQLPLATAAYGSLQNWSGAVWFAWQHGDRMFDASGHVEEEREAHLGDMVEDAVMKDHLRTSSILFRDGLVAVSSEPRTIVVEEPFTAADYGGLMRGQHVLQPGWANVHKIRKTFGEAPADQASSEILSESAPTPLVSDTGEIRKDVDRGQLTVAAPAAEGFSGTLDGEAPAHLEVLAGLEGEGFATVILVAADGKSLRESKHLIVSRTATDAGGAEVDGPSLTLRDVADAAWSAVATRARSGSAGARREVTAGDDGLVLPDGDWTELELTR